MNVSKNFFVIILCLNLGLPLFSSETTNPTENTESLFGIISYLKVQPNAKAKETGSWLENTYATRRGADQQLVEIANDNTKTRPEKIKALVEFRQKDENPEPENNTSYFSSMSTYTKAAAAFIVAAGIASYFYFMRPWGSSTE